MKRNYIGLALSALIMVAALLSLPSCGHDQKLVSIAVAPAGLSITGEGLIVNFNALGTYIHPPENKDITNSVVWASSLPQAISIDPNTGVAVSGTACGTNISITATAYSNPQSKTGSVVVGTALVNVAQVPPCT
jgi:hypothetical protein